MFCFGVKVQSSCLGNNMKTSALLPWLLTFLATSVHVRSEYQSAGCSDEGCGIPCYLRPPEDDCHYTKSDPCDGGGTTELDEQLRLLNNSLVRLQEKLVQKGIIPAGNTCPPLPAIEDGGVIYTDLLLSVGVVANFVCNEGYSLHGHGRYECSVDGVWIGDDAQEITEKPTCEDSLIVCVALVPIPNGHISYHIVDTSMVQPGDVVSYSCDTLYTLQGEQHRICLRNATWSGTEPVCIAPATTEPSQATSTGDNRKVSIPLGLLAASVAVLAVVVTVVVVVKCVRKRKNKKRGTYEELTEDDGVDVGSEKKHLTTAVDEETLQAHKSVVATLQAEHISS